MTWMASPCLKPKSSRRISSTTWKMQTEIGLKTNLTKYATTPLLHHGGLLQPHVLHGAGVSARGLYKLCLCKL